MGVKPEEKRREETRKEERKRNGGRQEMGDEKRVNSNSQPANITLLWLLLCSVS
jgi:hypothetical protein